MKSLFAIGVVVLLPFLAIFSILYFGLHKLQRIAAMKTTIVSENNIPKTISI